MADSSRSITGTVNVREADRVASVARAMADSLWHKKHGSAASMADADYFLLVRMCANVLAGSMSATAETIRERVAEFNGE